MLPYPMMDPWSDALGEVVSRIGVFQVAALAAAIGVGERVPKRTAATATDAAG